MKNGGYSEVAHTADLALKIWGDGLYALINSAAEGMYSLMGVEYDENIKQETDFSLPIIDGGNILVDLLNELLFLCVERKVLLRRFGYIILDDQVQIFGEVHDILKINREIKAATYHALNIYEKDHVFETILTFDV